MNEKVEDALRRLASVVSRDSLGDHSYYIEQAKEAISTHYEGVIDMEQRGKQLQAIAIQALRDENERLKTHTGHALALRMKDENEQLRKELSNDTQTIATLEQQLFESTTKEIADLKQQLAQVKPLDGDALYEVLCEHRENECALVEDARILVESICKHFGTGLKPLSYDKVRDIIVGGSAYSVNEVERIATEICKYSKTGGE